MARLRELPELRDVATDQQDRGLEATLEIDRDTAARLDVTPALIDDTLYDAFGQRQVAVIYTELNQYHVVMEWAPRYTLSPGALRDIYVPGIHLNEAMHGDRVVVRIERVKDGGKVEGRDITKLSESELAKGPIWGWSPSEEGRVLPTLNR